AWSPALAGSAGATALLATAASPGAVKALAGSPARDIEAPPPEAPVALVVPATSPALGSAVSSQLAARLAEAHLAPVVSGGTDTARTLVTLKVWLDSQLHAARQLRPARRDLLAGRPPGRARGPPAGRPPR